MISEAVLAASELPPEDTQSKTAALCADLTLQLEAQGWREVNIRPLRRFIQVSATDPNGASHGGAREDGASLIGFLLSLGATIKVEAPQAAAPAVDVREAVAKLAEEVNPSTEPEPKPKAEEAIPVPLARIVPPNLDLMAQKKWAAQRWLDLNARLLDEAKPADKRAFNPMSPAEKGELELLQRWIGWFS